MWFSRKREECRVDIVISFMVEMEGSGWIKKQRNYTKKERFFNTQRNYKKTVFVTDNCFFCAV